MSEVINLDLDEELLSHLPDAEAWVTLRGETFKPVLIADDEVRDIYRWQDEHIREHKQPATAIVLEEQFDITVTEPVTAIGDLIDRLRVRYMNDRGRLALKEIGEEFQKDPGQVPKLLLQQGKELTSLLNRNGEMFGTGDFARAKQRYYDKATKGPGPSLGFEELDDYFYGQRGVTIYLGPPKTWKSWFMVKAEIANVVKGKASWLYSLELPAEETHMRMQCMIAGIPWWKYLRDAISREEMDLLEEASMTLDEMGVYRIAKPPQGERSIDDLVNQAGDAGADVVFIDQLQYVEIDGRSLGEWNETGKYFGVLDRARNYSDDIPICFAHQFNRSTMNSDSMPSVQQAKGSAAIEETATLALGIWANKDMRQSSQCEIGTLVSRNNMYQAWNVGIELSRGCDFEILGRADEDE